jgi:hypothetical protein
MHQSKGKHAVRLSLKRVLQGQTIRDFAAFELDVVQLKQGAMNNPSRTWGTDLDANLAVSYLTALPLDLHLGGRRATWVNEAAMALYGAAGQYPLSLVLTTWTKDSEWRRRRPMVSCFHNGKKIGWKPATAGGGGDYEHWTYQGKKQLKSRWTRHTFLLNYVGIFLRKGPNGRAGNYSQPPHWLAENPGKYRCVMVDDGNIMKEWNFEVIDGDIVRPECQNQSVSSFSSVYLVKTTTKSIGTGKWNKKAGAKAGFEGRAKWAKGCPP